MEKINLCIKILNRLGYNAELKEQRDYIYFTCNGSDGFIESHKNIVRDILGDSLKEFFYAGGNKQIIYYKQPKNK
jgi:hypothetical protein